MTTGANRILDDFAKLMTDAAGAAQGVRKEAETVFRGAQDAYARGLFRYIEVLDAQRSLFNAELSLALAQAQELASGVRLYKALGGPWSELGTARD